MRMINIELLMREDVAHYKNKSCSVANYGYVISLGNAENSKCHSIDIFHLNQVFTIFYLHMTTIKI